MPLSVLISSRRTAARTGSLNSGGVIGIFCSSKISISAIFIYCSLSGNCFIWQNEREGQSKQRRLRLERDRLSPPLEKRDLSRSGVFSAHHQCMIEIIFAAHIFVYSRRFFCVSLYIDESKFLDLTGNLRTEVTR